MSVKADDLDNPERDLALLNRETNGPQRAKKPPTELEALRNRISEAREITRPRFHCSHCAQAFMDGRDATVRAIDG